MTNYYIKWDYLEDRYVSSKGVTYKTLEDIPTDKLHLVKPIKPIKAFRLKSVRGVKVDLRVKTI
jgi:hypothetical protein